VESILGARRLLTINTGFYSPNVVEEVFSEVRP
jgi:hypothetical protein